MRWIASIKDPDSYFKRLMIYEYAGGSYLFCYTSVEDRQSDWEKWYVTTMEAKKECETDYGVLNTEWTEIPDALLECQHDWVAPVRVKGRNEGKPEPGCFEELVDGAWRTKA